MTVDVLPSRTENPRVAERMTELPVIIYALGRMLPVEHCSSSAVVGDIVFASVESFVLRLPTARPLVL
jgi:hypothetical protein